MTREIIPGEPQHNIQRRTFATILSIPTVLVLATGILVGVWLVLTLSLIFALLACAALVAVGLPICIFLAKRSWRRKFPPSQAL
jgi:membrane protein YdbS with pleckstrin-like domain